MAKKYRIGQTKHYTGLSKIVYQCKYIKVLVKMLKAVEIFTNTTVNVNNQIKLN